MATVYHFPGDRLSGGRPTARPDTPSRRRSASRRRPPVRPAAPRRPGPVGSVPVGSVPVGSGRPGGRPGARGGRRPPLRLTRRGRVVVRAAIGLGVALLVGAVVFLASRPLVAGAEGRPAHVRSLVVLPGEGSVGVPADR